MPFVKFLGKMLTDNDKRDIEKQTGVALDKDQKGNWNERRDSGDVLFNILQCVLEQDEEISAVFKKDKNFNKHLNSPYAKLDHWGIAELKRDIADKKRQLEVRVAKEVKELIIS